MGKVDWNIDEQMARATRAVVRGVNETLEIARGVAAEATPVDSGWLRANWAITEIDVINDLHVRGTLYNPVEYAPFVNDGTARMQGHHMLQQAIDTTFFTVGDRIRKNWK